jgi:hypothetical protein
VLYRAERVCSDLRKVFALDEQLARGLPLLDNIERWIKEDVSFQGLPYETRFREENHGFTAAGNGYEIVVPEIFRVGRRYIAEEYIEGHNLTQWDLLAEKQEGKETPDRKEIISLLLKNIFHQLQSGLLHGDIHVGNIRVTPERKIAWLDRNYLLELTPQDQQFLAGLYGTAEPAGMIASYLCSFPENGEVNEEKLREAVQSRSSSRIESTTTNGAKRNGTMNGAGRHGDGPSLLYSLSGIVSDLYQAGGSLPLKPLLLAKNALAIDRLVQRAGFADWQEAVGYKRSTEV